MRPTFGIDLTVATTPSCTARKQPNLEVYSTYNRRTYPRVRTSKCWSEATGTVQSSVAKVANM